MKATFHRLSRGLLNQLGMAKTEPPPAFHKSNSKTHLSDVRRSLAIYQCALWGSEFLLRRSTREYGKHEGYKVYAEHNSIYLPAAYSDCTLLDGTHITAVEIYRAAAAHAAAHLVYTKKTFVEDKLSKWQKAVIAVIEDARIEALAARRFPGLKRLWIKQHMAMPTQQASANGYLNRLARALLDESYTDDDAWIVQGRGLFNGVSNLEDQKIAHDIGLTLAHDFLEKNINVKLRSFRMSALYRDDNRYLWERPEADNEEEPPPVAYFKHRGLFYAKESVKDKENKDDTSKRKSRKENRYVISEPYIYPEWNYRGQVETPSWVTLLEMSFKPGNLQVVENIIAQNTDLITRMKVLLDAMRLGGMSRIRKIEQGDEVDVNAAILAQIDLRQGVQPDMRVMTRTVRKGRDISVLVLLDLSKSTNEKVRGQSRTVLQLTQEVCVLFADAVNKVGDPFAIHGFCSTTRHYVKYFRFKDFNQSYDDEAKAKLAGMTGQESTRMGAAIRHATHLLGKQPSGKKLLLLITDGEPSDVDVHDRRYLRQDTKRAIEKASRSGIHTYCIGLDAGADQYASGIFGERNYMVVDHVQSLPEKLIHLYAELSR